MCKISCSFVHFVHELQGPSRTSTASVRQSESKFKTFYGLNGVLVVTIRKKKFVHSSASFTFSDNQLENLSGTYYMQKHYLVLNLVFNSLFSQRDNGNDDGGNNKACSSYTGCNNGRHL